MTSQSVVEAPTRSQDLRLWRALVLLAEPAQSSPETLPAPRVQGRVEGHVFEFDEAYTEFVEGFSVLPSEEQMLALQAVDTKVASMVAKKDATLWTEAARREHFDWRELRDLAGRVLSAFNWPDSEV